MNNDYYLVDLNNKKINIFSVPTLEKKVLDCWFDITSNSFNRLAFYDSENNSYLVEKYDDDRINFNELIDEIERIDNNRINNHYIRTIRESNVNGGAYIYRCIYSKVENNVIYLFDKDKTLFVIHRLVESLLGSTIKKDIVYVVSQPYWNVEIDNIVAFDTNTFVGYYGIHEIDNLNEYANKILKRYKEDYPLPDDELVSLQLMKPLFKASTYPLPYNKDLIKKSKFRPTYIYK